MRGHVEVTERHSDLHQTTWRFYYLSGAGAVLDEWRDERRDTKRHKFKATKWEGTVWTRLGQRDVRVDRPDVPAHIAAEALRLFRESVTFADGETY